MLTTLIQKQHRDMLQSCKNAYLQPLPFQLRVHKKIVPLPRDRLRNLRGEPPIPQHHPDMGDIIFDHKPLPDGLSTLFGVRRSVRYPLARAPIVSIFPSASRYFALSFEGFTGSLTSIYELSPSFSILLPHPLTVFQSTPRERAMSTFLTPLRRNSYIFLLFLLLFPPPMVIGQYMHYRRFLVPSFNN